MCYVRHILFVPVCNSSIGSSSNSFHLAVDHWFVLCVHLAMDHFLYYFVNSSSGGREFTWRWISDLYHFLLFCVLYYSLSSICCSRVFIWRWISGLHYIFFTTLYCSCSSVHLAVDQRLSGGEYSTSVCLWQLRKRQKRSFKYLNECSTTDFF